MDCPECDLAYPMCNGELCPAPVYHTQGGGLVKWDKMQLAYVFVESLPGFNFRVGDFMPEEWGIA